MSQESTDLFKVGQAIRQELDLYVTKVSLGNIPTTSESSMQSYTTEELPGNSPKGTIAFDTTINEHVYFNDGRWLKLSDNTLVADRVVEVYILSGQSNAGGTADSANLANWTQKDGEGNLLDTRSDILITVNSPSDQSGNGGVLSPSGLHGPEVSFLDGIDYLRTKKQFLVKYYSGGSSIDTWNKEESQATDPQNNRNNWDKLTTSIDNAITWATNSGYALEWKGFVWWQGESDRAPDNTAAKEEYKLKLQTLIANVRTHVDKAELPVCVIEVDNRYADDANGTNSASTSGMSEIQDAQAEVAEADAKVEFIDVTQYGHLMDWSGPRGDGKYDGVHWQTEAYVKIGWDAAERMNDIIEGTLTYDPPSPILWLDPSDESTVTYNSGGNNQISELRDKSGNDYHAGMSVGSYQPVYNVNPINGLATVQAAPNKSLFSLNPNPADWQDVYVVADLDSHTASDNFYEFIGLFEGIGSVDSANIGIQGYRGTQDLNQGWFDQLHLNGTETSRVGILPELLDPFLISASKQTNVAARGYCIGVDRYGFTTDRVTYSGTVYRCKKNHSGVTTTPDLDSTNWEVETDDSYIGSDDWVSGGTYKLTRHTAIPIPSRGWKGPIGEILVFDRKLTDSERQEVEGYLAHKWGIAGRLPAEHPYKTEAP